MTLLRQDFGGLSEFDPETASRPALIARIDALEARLQGFDALDAADAVQHLRAAFGLAPFEARILSLLSSGRLARRTAIHAALYGGDPDGGPDPKVIDVHMLRVRAKLPPPMRIDNVWGEGFILAEGVATVAAVAGGDAEAIAGFAADLPARTRPGKRRADDPDSVTNRILKFVQSRNAGGGVFTLRQLMADAGQPAGRMIAPMLRAGWLVRAGEKQRGFYRLNLTDKAIKRLDALDRVGAQ